MFEELYKKIDKSFSSMSKTEKIALFSGDSSLEKMFFSGDIELNDIPEYSKLTTEEQKFLNNETKQLCSLIDENKISKTKKIPDEVFEFIKENKFWALNIPKEYNGLGFSKTLHSKVISMIASKSFSTAVTVMVPNSLGPAELLLKYGTLDQKNQYLPKLSIGEEIPCFALTSPTSGSDAASISDEGIVFEENGKLFIKLNFNKRYITLSPIATLIGLAFKLKDPDNLLPDNSEGITIALLHRKLKGISIKRHNPSDLAFYNGPITGKNVIIPVDNIIGGAEEAGKGWKMLMECLAEGRGLSLPALSLAASETLLLHSISYSMVREQFNTPLINMEAIQRMISEMSSLTYQQKALVELTNTLLDKNIKPSVISSIMKYIMTEKLRKVVNLSMDLHGGMAICKGQNNIISDIYKAVPIAITVEGSNTITKSLIITGQGLLKSHPIMPNLIKNVLEKNKEEGKSKIKDLVCFSLTNFLKAVLQEDIGFFRRLNEKKYEKFYNKELIRLSTKFSLIANITLLSIQKNIKREEMLSSVMSDILSDLYTALAVYVYHLRTKKNSFIFRYTMKSLFNNIENNMKLLVNNYPNGFKKILSFFILYKKHEEPKFDTTRKIIKNIKAELPVHLFEEVFLDEINIGVLEKLNFLMINNANYRHLKTLESEDRFLHDYEEIVREVIQVSHYDKNLNNERIDF